MAKILIIGAGVSGLTLAWSLRRAGCRVRVLEKSDKPGGAIGTVHRDDWLFENGPNSFLDNASDTLELCRELRLENELLKQSMRANARFIYLRNELHEVPMHPGGLYSTRLLSPAAKRRLLTEPLRRGNRSVEDESLADFVRRRLGENVLRNLVTPFVSGVYAGDPEKLSLRATFPILYELERQHGGLFRGMISRSLFRKKDPNSPKKPRAKNLCSFIDGMQTLTDAMARALGDDLWLANSVTRVEMKVGGGFRVHAKGFAAYTEESDVVVFCAPAYETARLAQLLIPRSAKYLSNIPYNRLVVTGLGYPRESVRHPSEGFGFLAPRGEGVRILGAIWSSSLFPRRAPGGHHAYTVFLGGGLDPEVYDRSDDDILATCARDLGVSMGVEGEPRASRIVRWERAIPQYPIGHVERIQEMMHESAEVPGLYVGGNFIEGVSVNDCIRNARGLARAIAAEWKDKSSTVQEPVV